MTDARLLATNPENSSLVPVACNAQGQLLVNEVVIEGIDNDVTVNGDLDVTGAATFAGRCDIGNSFLTNDVALKVVSNYSPSATLYVQNFTNDGDVFSGRNANNDETSRIGVNGSASFAGDVRVGENAGAGGDPGVRVTAGGGIFTNVSSVDDYVYTSSVTGDNTANIVFRGNGAAEFGGDVEIGGDASNGGEVGTTISKFGFVHTCRESDSNVVWSGYKRGNSTSTSEILASGAASFAGGKAGFTADGHLWCTTRRGDTVILDATSNGLASWADYTPPTRRDLIKEKLDALEEGRGDVSSQELDET